MPSDIGNVFVLSSRVAQKQEVALQRECVQKNIRPAVVVSSRSSPRIPAKLDPFEL